MNFFYALNFIDQKISVAIVYLRSEFWDNFFYFTTSFGAWYVIVILVILVCYIFWLNNKKTLITPFLITVAGSGIVTVIIKFLVNRARPGGDIALYTETLSSFPSAHAALISGLFGILIYFLWRFGSKSIFGRSLLTKIILTVIFILVIILVGFSRLYLGVHYLSDVLAGYLVGLMWLLIGMHISGKNSSLSNNWF
jgi:membrane-associated phospholipid phosphatase